MLLVQNYSVPVISNPEHLLQELKIPNFGPKKCIILKLEHICKLHTLFEVEYFSISALSLSHSFLHLSTSLVCDSSCWLRDTFSFLWRSANSSSIEPEWIKTLLYYTHVWWQEWEIVVGNSDGKDGATITVTAKPEVGYMYIYTHVLHWLWFNSLFASSLLPSVGRAATTLRAPPSWVCFLRRVLISRWVWPDTLIPLISRSLNTCKKFTM